MIRSLPALLAAALLAAPPALAHVTLDPAEAAANASVRVAFRVPHGCAGAATTAIEVTLPEGVTMARPMPKPGWTLEVDIRPLARPFPGPHGLIRESPAAVAWRGGPLADAHYDEFVMILRTPDRPAETLHFPVMQRCEGGASHAWTEVADAANPRPRSPAATLRLAPR
ncbi:MAG: YcnI family protein [Acetobacteraceae bacterium]|nr:YcnI family protein [Acetobacteraceae bacterium]